jgi:hypothetical protein
MGDLQGTPDSQINEERHMKKQLAAVAASGALGLAALVGFAGVSYPSTPALALVTGSHLGCTVTWSARSIGPIGSYEAFTFTSTPASSPSSVGPANAAHGVHPGATVTSVEQLPPVPTSALAKLTFHVVNNYGQQQTINLTIPTPGC